jgi:filamentous hemagglutinin family protein
MLKSGKANFWITFSIALGTVSLWNLAKIVPVRAQIVPDGTLPTEVSSPDNLNFTINGGATAGSNLFHSFEEFSVPTNGQAFFNNATDIVNIFSRVTGGNLSNIDGLLRANGTANLFLLNPNGIVFGQNASLNIGGSFFGTTANSLLFPDGLEFNTNVGVGANGHSPLLSVNVPIGLQIGVNPGKIVVEGTGNNLFSDPDSGILFRDNRPIGLEVKEKTFALVSSDIELNGGNLTSRGGGIELGSLGDNQTVSINLTDNGWDLDYSEVTDFRDIELNAAASLDASGIGGGRIQIQGRNLFLNEGSAILSFTEGTQPGQNLRIRATESIELSGSNPLALQSIIATAVDINGNNNVGNLTLETNQLTLSDGAAIYSATFGQGNAGYLITNASELVTLSGLNSNGLGSNLQSIVSSEGTGNAGNLTVETGQLTLSDGAVISSSTLGEGNAGDLTIRATESIALSGLDVHVLGGLGSSLAATVRERATGDAGNLTVETGQLTLSDGAVISSSTLGEGNAGDLTIRATESITLSGLADNGLGSSLQNGVAPQATGDAGNLTVETGQLTLSDGAAITSSTFGEGNAGDLTIRATESIALSGLNADGLGSSLEATVREWATGDAGNLTVETGQLTLSDGAVISSSTFGEGNAGDLSIRATESIALSGLNADGFGSSLQNGVAPQVTGNAGNLTVETGQLTLSDGAAIISSTFGEGNAGALTIRATESIALSGLNADGLGSSLEATVREWATGDAGNLTVETGQLTLSDGAVISSSTFGEGNAGDLSIRATESIALSGLNADGFGSSLQNGVAPQATGDAGNLTVETGQLTLSDGAFITSATFGQGNAGNLTIRAAESLTLSGLNSRGVPSWLAARVRSEASGNAGNLTVETGQLSLSDGALISSETLGNGNAGTVSVLADEVSLRDEAKITVTGVGEFSPGSIRINSDRLLLDNQSAITADTESGNQGNIELSTNSLFLRHNSNIRTNATGEATGGNITINSGVLAALENSDISANAEDNFGGRVIINVAGIFGTEFRMPKPPKAILLLLQNLASNLVAL